jgi:hypothetical protein
MHFVSQAGPTTEKSGPEVAPVSPSVPPESGGGKSDERHLWPGDLLARHRDRSRSAPSGSTRRPPIVCSSIADDLGVGILDEHDSSLVPRAARARRDSLVGLNYAFDLGVMCAADPRLVRPVFAALEQKRVHDVGIREALIDIARGNLIEAGEDEMGIRYGMRELSKRYFGKTFATRRRAPTPGAAASRCCAASRSRSGHGPRGATCCATRRSPSRSSDSRRPAEPARRVSPGPRRVRVSAHVDVGASNVAPEGDRARGRG